MIRFSGLILILLSLFVCIPAIGQNHTARFESIDVIQYVFDIQLNDSTDRIEATADVVFQNKKPLENLVLDLTNIDSKGLGMTVESLQIDDQSRKFKHENDQLTIDFKTEETDTTNLHKCHIKYSGTPADGLIISKNKYGDRTFFGDNWPNRAHNWLPTIDHPSDKAKVTFSVTAPAHYRVVANGALDTIIELSSNYKKTIWKESIPISTKLMVFGAADFKVGNDTVWNGIPVNAWVFKENQEKGLENYRYGTKALEYYSELIGPYSYEKLAHVQSKTRYGGMENASCIFYSENSAISDRSQEGLFAHEVAHQWFGDCVTEQNWHHVWLSEGFATYLAHVYNQHFYGEETFRDGLRVDRERVIRFFQRYPAPIIDTLQTDYSRLLNANSYQKASWFLHMLRYKLGDDVFFAALRKYYADYQNSTALTSDFRKEMEEVSGEDLLSFFNQWLRQAGHPVLKWNWKQSSDSNVSMDITQTQDSTIFNFLLEIAVFYNDGNQETFRINIDQKTASFTLPTQKTVQKIELDPDVNLLFEEAK